MDQVQEVLEDLALLNTDPSRRSSGVQENLEFSFFDGGGALDQYLFCHGENMLIWRYILLQALSFVQS